MNGTRRLVGLTSFGNGCADPKYPGAYTRLSTYYDWVSSYVSDNLRSSSSRLVFQRKGGVVRSVNLRNTGYLAAKIGKISINSGPFRLVRSNCGSALLAGATCQLAIWGTGKGQGKLRVRSKVGYSLRNISLVSL